jgi:uncharacterized protein YjbJ (UPF0337 family)
VSGVIDKISGKFKQLIGDVADDPGLRGEGLTEERKGQAKEELAETEQRADRKAEEIAALERRQRLSR